VFFLLPTHTKQQEEQDGAAAATIAIDRPPINSPSSIVGKQQQYQQPFH
jgi:hypothetical protein